MTHSPNATRLRRIEKELKTLDRRSASKKMTKELLADVAWTRNEQWSSVIGDNVYLHPDGRVLHIFSIGNAVLYSKTVDFEKFFGIFQELQIGSAHHYLEDIFPYGEEFPQNIIEVSGRLSELFNLKPEQLDYSIESLTLVSQKVKRFGKTKAGEPPYFAPLLAYTTEVVRRAVNGHIEMVQPPQFPDIWEPWIVDANGVYTEVYTGLWKLFNESGSIDLNRVVAQAIGFRHRKAPYHVRY